MGKLVTLLIIMSGISLVMYFGGVITDTANSALLDMVLNPERFQLASIITKLAVAITGLLTTITIILRAGANNDQYLMIPLVMLFVSFGWDFLRVYQAMASSSPIGEVIGVLIFGPLMLGYVLSVIEWWRGVST